jgi:hypothetical protein
MQRRRHTLEPITMTTLLITDPINPGCVVSERSRTRTHVWIHLHAQQLDHALASGVSPDSSAALSLRAYRLIGETARAALARSVRRLVEDARRPLGPLDPPICRRKVRRSTQTLHELADRLVSGDPVDACGVAQIRLLMQDAAGPIYDRPAADDLEPALRRARQALELTV